MQACDILALIGATIWIVVLLLPWKPYFTRESLDVLPVDEDMSLSDVTVIIPARNEGKVIQETLNALKNQGKDLNVILVDDESQDDTAEKAKTAGMDKLKIVQGMPLPAGWTGKLWALQQGLRFVDTPFTLLMDADISLKKGIIKTLKKKMIKEGWDMISLMAMLNMKGFWEKLLIPSFIYFFKLIYPFSLCSKKDSPVAAAAGGCIFIRTEALKKIGGFESIKHEIIDDCALAKRIKKAGYNIWIGLTHSVISRRSYKGLYDIWNMVARTAFTQLRYSITMLILCSIMLVASFLFPFSGIFSRHITGISFSLVALVAMMLTYIPTLNYYGIPKMWALTLPFSGILYLMMTWSSAIRYFKGQRSEWKGRIYSAHDVS